MKSAHKLKRTTAIIIEKSAIEEIISYEEYTTRDWLYSTML